MESSQEDQFSPSFTSSQSSDSSGSGCIGGSSHVLTNSDEVLHLLKYITREITELKRQRVPAEEEEHGDHHVHGARGGDPQSLNKAAKAILDGYKDESKWTARNFLDDKRACYILQDTARYVALAEKYEFVAKLRKHFTFKCPTTFEDGKELESLVAKMFQPKMQLKQFESIAKQTHGQRKQTEKARIQWLMFIKDCAVGLFNPTNPRLSGASTNDYALRVNRLSSKIRECIFGPDTTTKFDYPGAAARTFHPIFLPTASDIIEEVKDKLDQRGRNERKYIMRYAEEHAKFLKGTLICDEVEARLHSNSTAILEEYFARPEFAKRDKKGMGKARLFSDLYLLSDLSKTRRVRGTAAGTSSRCAVSRKEDDDSGDEQPFVDEEEECVAVGIQGDHMDDADK